MVRGDLKERKDWMDGLVNESLCSRWAALLCLLPDSRLLFFVIALLRLKPHA